MAELDGVINRAEAFERESAKAAEFAQESERKPVSSSEGNQTDSLDAAKNMAESLLKTGEKIVQAFADHRLYVDADETQACKEGLGPFIDKYNLAHGDGKVPFQEEMHAGFYLGGLYRRFRRALAGLRAEDKAKREKADGSEREREPQKPAHAVSGEVRVREKSDTQAEGWNTEQWSTGGAVGREQGSQGTPV